MKKSEIIRAWKSNKSKEEIAKLIGSPEVNKEIVRGGLAAAGDSAGYLCTVSGETWPYISCDPRRWFD